MKENKELNQGMIMQALDYGYEKAVNGISGFVSAAEMAEDYMNNGKDLIANANSLIRWQISKAGTQKVGFRLLTKFGEKGAINLGKAIPVVGGVIGGTFDSVATNTIGNIARLTFIETK